MDSLDWVQWPAMAVTILAAWLVASSSERKRAIGFYAFLASNVLWITWGTSTSAYALIVLQLFLAFTNIRGASKNDAT
ncbi:MAG: hypothetical protein ABI650_11885 [Dokdonella sp.]